MTDPILTNSGEPTELIGADVSNTMAFANAEALDALENAPVGPSIEPKYYEFKVEGESIRGYYSGMGHITKNVKDKETGAESQIQLPAAILQTKDGLYLQAGASLVSQVANIPPGTPIQITFLGEEKTKSGNKVKKYGIKLLAAPRIAAVAAPRLQAPASQPALTGDVAVVPDDIQLLDVHGKELTEIAAAAWQTDNETAARRVWRLGLDGLLTEPEFRDWLKSNP